MRDMEKKDSRWSSNCKVENVPVKQERGRHQTRWYDILKKNIGVNSIREADNKGKCKSKQAAYVQFG